MPSSSSAHPPTRPKSADHCRTLIAGYKVPKQIDVRDEPLPKSGAGKILKRVLRDEYWTGHRQVSGA